MKREFPGVHYETGTIVNALSAIGAIDPVSNRPYSEALVLGASGGIAVGYFVFEYTGMLPHVALLTRNTFSPFERALDNLGIRRETRETINPAKAEENLRREIESGVPALVWADIYSLPHYGLPDCGMWMMRPMLVVGIEGDDFLLVDRPGKPHPVSAERLLKARGRVKKERYRLMTLEAPDPDLLRERLPDAVRTCVSLYFDKPPAGAATNFGLAATRQFAKLLRDEKGAKGWAATFAPGPRLANALAGAIGQPGVWDWIERWGSAPGADRRTYAAFLREASAWLDLPDLERPASKFDLAAPIWRELAEAALPDALPGASELKALKSGPSTEEVRTRIRLLVGELAASEELITLAPAIRQRMAGLLDQIAEIEERAFTMLRELFPA